MLFVLSKLFWILLSPLSLLVLAFALGLLGLLAGRLFHRPLAGRWGRGLLAAAAAVLVAVTLLPVDVWLLRPLEERFPQVTAPPPDVDGVLVLGGAVRPSDSAARGAPQFGKGAERIFAMIELARRYPEARVVFTGGTASLTAPELREADQVRALLADLGLLAPRMVFERASRNTRENALYSHDLVGPGKTERWLLVTSAFHMPRALGTFRTLGWPVVAYPVDYRSPSGGGLFHFEPLERLQRLHDATKEWIGLLYYRLRGWTEVLFPAPEGSRDS